MSELSEAYQKAVVENCEIRIDWGGYVAHDQTIRKETKVVFLTETDLWYFYNGLTDKTGITIDLNHFLMCIENIWAPVEEYLSYMEFETEEE